VNLKQGLTNVGFAALAPAMPLIVQQMCEGLGYFHKQGWIHRDVKPDNFMCSEAGDVKLIDFALAEKKKSGLARFFGGKVKVQGTRSYMSPEQILGKALDSRSDIYSLACTIFQLLCGTAPFTGSNPNDVLQEACQSSSAPLGIAESEHHSRVQQGSGPRAGERSPSSDPRVRSICCGK